MKEGVTQFSCELEHTSPSPDPELRALQEARKGLFLRDVIGCDLKRYGACYGNLSARLGPWAAPAGRREFLISCTQTGADPEPGAEAWVRVRRYDHAQNRVWASGPCAPSSESMTHGALYDAELSVRAVVHGHDRQTWLWLLANGAPSTPPDVAYGTPAMAERAGALVRKARRAPWRHPNVFAMGGHEDGIVAWGDSVAHATQCFLAVWEAARIR